MLKNAFRTIGFGNERLTIDWIVQFIKVNPFRVCSDKSYNLHFLYFRHFQS